jgi:hypothetical protein
LGFIEQGMALSDERPSAGGGAGSKARPWPLSPAMAVSEKTPEVHIRSGAAGQRHLLFLASKSL